MSRRQGREAREGCGCRQGGPALPSLTSSTAEPGMGPCTSPRRLPWVRAEPLGEASAPTLECPLIPLEWHLAQAEPHGWLRGCPAAILTPFS